MVDARQYLDKLSAFLSAFYYSLEDKYYAMLDWFEGKGIPVYKVVDPIDEVIPSFAVFCLLILLLIFAIIWLLFFSAPQYSISVKVIDLSSNQPIPRVRVDYNYGSSENALNLSGTALTMSDGTFQIENLSGELYFDFYIKKAGYLDFRSETRKITIDSTSITLKLEKKQAVPNINEKKIVVRDGSVTPKRRIEGQKIDVSFSCSTGKSIPAKSSMVADITVTKTELNGCGTITATVDVLGFEAQTQVLGGDITIFDLTKSSAKKGKLKVFVKDIATGALLPGMTLNIYKGSVTNPKGTAMSDESGSWVFEQEPGMYAVSAVDDENHNYDLNTTGLIEVEADKVSEITLFLARKLPSAERHLRILVKDSNTNSGLEGANVYYSMDGVFKPAPVITNSEGKVVIEGASEGKEYYVRVVLAGFVSKFMRVYPKLPTDSNYDIIVLDRITEVPKNYGTIRVFVKNDLGSVVPEATVRVYNADFLTVPIIDTTDNTGYADLGNESLPAGEYVAYAEKTYVEAGQTIDANAIEGPRALVIGQTLDFNLTLTLGIANLKAKVLGENGQPIRDANVFFYESIGPDAFNQSAKFTATTDALGMSNPVAYFRVDKKVKIVVTKEGYFNSVRIVDSLYRAQASRPIIVNIDLINRSDYSEFSIKFREELFPEGCNGTPLPKIEENKEKVYGMLFNIIVPESQQDNVKAHVRSGLNSIINASELGMDIKSASPSIYHPVLSADYNRDNAFSDQNFEVVDGINVFAKQANLSPGILSGGVYSFCINTRVKKLQNPPSPNPPIEFEIHYTARSDQKGVLPERVKKFYLGQLFCRTNCPKFDYEFSICKNVSESCGSRLNYLSPGSIDSFDINYSEDYLLYYSISNNSGQDISENVNALFFTDNNALNFKYSSLESKTYEENIVPEGLGNVSVWSKDTSTAVLSFAFKGVSKTNTKLSLVLNPLNSEMSDANTFVYFDINASAYNVSYPQSLLSNFPRQQLQVIVSDSKTGRRLSGALVQIKISNQRSNVFGDVGDPSYREAYTDIAGIAPFTLINAYSSTQFLLIHVVAKPGFEESPVYNVPFVDSLIQTGDEFACVKFVEITNECYTGSGTMCLQAKNPAKSSGTFKILNDNCADTIVIRPSGTYTSFGSQVSLPITPTTDITLQKGQTSSEITVNTAGRIPQDIMGQFPIFVRLKYAGDQDFRPGKEFTVFVDYPQAYQQCFGIGKTAFDLSTQPEDSNQVSNACYIDHSDPEVPFFNFSPDPLAYAFVSSIGELNIEPYAFNWRIRAFVNEAVRGKAVVWVDGNYPFVIKMGLENDITFQGTTVTPDPLATGVSKISDEVKQITRLRLIAYKLNEPPTVPPRLPGFILDPKPFAIEDTKITLTMSDGSSRDVSVPCHSTNQPMLGTVWECSFQVHPSVECPGGMAHPSLTCEMRIMDIDLGTLQAGGLGIDKITAKFLNPNNDYLSYFELVGKVKDIVNNNADYSYDFATQWYQGFVTPGRQLPAQLGEMTLTLNDIKKSPQYHGGVIKDLQIVAESSDSKVDAWIMGNIVSEKLYVFAVYYGGVRNFTIANGKELIPLTLYNNGLTGNNYHVLTANDFVRPQ